MNVKGAVIIVLIGAVAIALYFAFFGSKPPGENPITAPVDYVDIVVRQPKKVQAKVDLMTVQNEIRQFQALKGQYPKNRHDLEEWRGTPLPALAAGASYQYDPSTGQISVQAAR